MNKILTIACALAFSSFVSANDNTTDKTTIDVNDLTTIENSFQTLDSDNNGLISLSEASSDDNLALVFSELDEDNDGQLSLLEYSNFSQ